MCVREEKTARDPRLRNKAQAYICANPGLHRIGDAVMAVSDIPEEGVNFARYVFDL